MIRLAVTLCFGVFCAASWGDTIRVPQEHDTIQAAIDAAKKGDVVQVSPGKYQERIQLKQGVTLRSSGDNTPGKHGLKRAEITIIDGGGKIGSGPGVRMANDSQLDGFTITNVGVYDDALWRKHFKTHGEELDDDEGSVQAEGTVPAVSVQAVTCVVKNNIVHHNGDVGIAIQGRPNNPQPTAPVASKLTVALIIENTCFRNLGGGIGIANNAEPIVKQNTCFENLRAGVGCRAAAPLILNNECYRNIRAGIGCREGATAIIRGNKCHHNRRAGIGIRMKKTSPLVENNSCFENDMAGIGNRDGASPVIRNNHCHKNKMAGIGTDGAQPLIIGNQCTENLMAGIGLRGKAQATVLNNRCLENKLVAIGVTQGSTATINGNELKRTGGVPPIVAVKDGSQATLSNNRIAGGGVAAVLIQGNARLNENRFSGAGEKQGTAVWIWKDSTAHVVQNSFVDYRTAVQSTQSIVTVSGNQISNFRGSAIIIKSNPAPVHVFGNRATSQDPQANIVEITGESGIVDDNQIKSPK